MALVVGMPAHPDGAPHAMTVRCERFARQLEGRYRLPVRACRRALQLVGRRRSARRRRSRRGGHSSAVAGPRCGRCLSSTPRPIYGKLARRAQYGDKPLSLVGVHTGGVWLAERLKRELNVEQPVGILDVSFYRDVRSIRLEAGSATFADCVRCCGQPHSPHRRCIEHWPHGARGHERDFRLWPPCESRPRSPDRPRRPRMPIAASIVGATIELPASVSVVLTRDDDDRLHLTMETRGSDG